MIEFSAYNVTESSTNMNIDVHSPKEFACNSFLSQILLVNILTSKPKHPHLGKNDVLQTQETLYSANYAQY